MADIEITVDGGTSKRLLTAGKYCDRDILVTATGGGGGEPDPPDDGKTRLYISIPPNPDKVSPPFRNKVPLSIGQTVDRGVTIDWGDGSELQTISGTGNVSITHTYEKSGDFIISLLPSDDCILSLGHGSINSRVIGSNLVTGTIYTLYVTKAILGKNVLEVGSYSFDGFTSMYDMIIGQGVSTLGSFSIYACSLITSLIIPSSVTEIRFNAFRGSGLKELHVKPEEPPTLDSAGLADVPSDCVIYVPVGKLDTYKNATNWSKFDSKMREEGT